MVRWSDLGASLQASPRAMLRPDLWREVLRRMLFSRVFAGHAVLALLLWLAQRSLANGLSGVDSHRMLFLLELLVVAAPALPLLVALLLLPYAYWVFAPAAARVLPAYLDLPPAVEDEPGFLRYFLWTLPAIALLVLVTLLHLVPAVSGAELGPPLLVAAMVLVLLSVLKLFTRAALAAHYPPQEIQLFLAATAWQRFFVWLPALLVLGWASDGLVAGFGQLLGLHGEYQTTTAGAVLMFGLQFLLGALAATVFTGVLLLACGRTGGAVIDTSTMLDSGLARGDRATRPMTREQLEAMRNVHRAQRRRRPSWLVAAGALGALALGLYFARLPLTDWYFAQDPAYAGATEGIVAVRQPGERKPRRLLDPAVRDERLRAGFIAYACAGDLERAQWIWRLGATSAWDHGRVLACAACSRQRGAVDWLLASDSELMVSLDLGQHKGQPITALACAARDNDVPLAQRLLQRAAQQRDFLPVSHALQAAASRQHWAMVRMLVQKDRTAAHAATFAALDAAYAQDPQKPAQLLPRMLEAGLIVHAVDRHRRTVFHWAAQRHDLALLRALMERSDPRIAALSLRRPDAQGALPWMYVLRKAELDGQPLSADATELLRLLLPADKHLGFVVTVARPGDAEALPVGWDASQAALAQPMARRILGEELEAFEAGLPHLARQAREAVDPGGR